MKYWLQIPPAKTPNMLTVNAFWDAEADVWVATSEDVPGLVTEAGSMDDLVAKLKDLIPDLLEANGREDGDVEFRLLSELTAVAPAH